MFHPCFQAAVREAQQGGSCPVPAGQLDLTDLAHLGRERQVWAVMVDHLHGENLWPLLLGHQGAPS